MKRRNLFKSIGLIPFIPIMAKAEKRYTFYDVYNVVDDYKKNKKDKMSMTIATDYKVYSPTEKPPLSVYKKTYIECDNIYIERNGVPVKRFLKDKGKKYFREVK